MRTLVLKLTSDDGKHSVEEPLFQLGEERNIGTILHELRLRLDVLERDGPWHPAQDGARDMQVVKNSLCPAPLEEIIGAADPARHMEQG